MAFLVVQGGNTLYKVDPSTGAATALTLPTGITLDTTRKPRFAVLNQWVVMVNSPLRNIAIDPEGNVRPLVPQAPVSPPLIAAGSGTGLTGTFQVKVSYVVFDTAGNLLMESPLSPSTPSLTIANKDIAITNIPLSTDSISSRRLYRNTTGGSSFYHWFDLDGNTLTAAQSNLADAALSILPAQPTILTPPPGTMPGTRLKTICAWKNRLWGASDDPEDADTVVYTEDGKVYAWPNSLTAYPKGQDAKGIVGFAPRKDQLGVIKRSGVWQITGTSNSNFNLVQLTEGKGGCVAPDTIIVVNDRGYWLGRDGVYEWSGEGIKNISDETVKPWFDKDSTYFNTARFEYAFARYNPRTNSVEFHLAANGSSVEDRWVSFNLTNRKWYGPHKTAAFTPSHGAFCVDSNNLSMSVVGGTDGKVYKANDATATDGASSAIDFDCYGPLHHANAPDVMHTFLQMSVNSKIESGGTLTITPKVTGRNGAEADQSSISHTLTLGHEVLRRIGDGRMVRFRLRENTNAQKVVVYGYEIPVFEIGRR
jgi:hypothetical protein